MKPRRARARSTYTSRSCAPSSAMPARFARCAASVTQWTVDVVAPMNRRRTLAAQIAIVTTLVAVVATAISFLVSANLIRGAAESQARSTLGHYADLIAAGNSDAA